LERKLFSFYEKLNSVLNANGDGRMVYGTTKIDRY